MFVHVPACTTVVSASVHAVLCCSTEVATEKGASYTHTNFYAFAVFEFEAASVRRKQAKTHNVC